MGGWNMKRIATCCFTGHRPEKLNVPAEIVIEKLKDAIEDAFSDCFGKPVIETEGRYSTATFIGTKEKVTMFYEYIEDKETISLRHILWEKFEE